MIVFPTFSTKQRIACLVIIISFNAGCRGTMSQATLVSNSKTLVQEEPAHIFSDPLMPSDSTDQLYKELICGNSVYRFYKIRNFRTVWVDNRRILLLGDSMISFIKEAPYYGLKSKNYHLQEIEMLKYTSHLQGSWLRIEALVTDAFISLAGDLKHGRLNSMIKERGDSIQLSLLEKNNE